MDPLAQLNDISMGNAIGLWPLAWGWWLIIAVALLLVTSIFLLWQKHKAFNAVRREALQEIKALQTGEINVSCQTTAINQVLKRCAIHYFDEVTVNKLYGPEWTMWLSQQLTDKHKAKFEKDMATFTNTLYSPPTDDSPNINAAVHAALLWISKARFKRTIISSTPHGKRGAHV